MQNFFDPDLVGRTAKLAAGGGRLLCVARRCFLILAGAERLFSPVIRCNALECHIPVWNRQQTHKSSSPFSFSSCVERGPPETKGGDLMEHTEATRT
jgi:hypothetical protein